MDIDPKLYGKLCPACRQAVDAFSSGDDTPPAEAPTEAQGGAAKPAKDEPTKPLEAGRKKAMSRVNGLAIIISPAEQVTRSEAAEELKTE